MATFARVLVAQLVLDAVGRWAEHATGLKALHAKQDTGRRALPYVSLEWRRRPVPKSAPYEAERTGLPLGGRITLTALEGEWSGATVNLARPRVQRGVGETLAELAVRLAVLLRPMLAGRVIVTTDGDDIVLAPVATGDLWRLSSIEGCTTTYEGGTGSARLIDRVWASIIRVRVIGAPATSGAAGQAGDGNSIAELLAAMQDALDRDWCRELFDQFGIRRTVEATEAPAEQQRANANLEDRSYFDLEIGISTRYAAAAEVAETIVVGVKLDQEPPPNDAPITDEVTING